MKQTSLLVFAFLAVTLPALAQHGSPGEQQRKDITALISQYSQAREERDTVLLKRILTSDIDQLVSSGEWRTGINSAVQGMLASSAESPGTRMLTVERLRMTGPNTALVDCRYDIRNPNGSIRRMWSSFVVVLDKRVWKISAIRNMLPSGL